MLAWPRVSAVLGGAAEPALTSAVPRSYCYQIVVCHHHLVFFFFFYIAIAVVRAARNVWFAFSGRQAGRQAVSLSLFVVGERSSTITDQSWNHDNTLILGKRRLFKAVRGMVSFVFAFALGVCENVCRLTRVTAAGVHCANAIHATE